MPFRDHVAIWFFGDRTAPITTREETLRAALVNDLRCPSPWRSTCTQAGLWPRICNSIVRPFACRRSGRVADFDRIVRCFRALSRELRKLTASQAAAVDRR